MYGQFLGRDCNPLDIRLLLRTVSFVDQIRGDAYNESLDLVEQIEAYRRRFGYYPASVHVDQIYRTRVNRQFCHSKGIRLSGPPLGRPRVVNESTAEQVKQDQQQGRDDATARMAIEGKFGQGKRRFGLARMMAKLALTAEAMIQISFLVMNLEHLLVRVGSFLCVAWWPSWKSTEKGLLGVRWLKLKLDCRARRGSRVETRWGWSPQLIAAW